MSDTVTEFGFHWGPMVVERTASVAGKGRVLTIRTEGAGEIQVYVSEKGNRIVVTPQGESNIVWEGPA